LSVGFSVDVSGSSRFDVSAGHGTVARSEPDDRDDPVGGAGLVSASADRVGGAVSRPSFYRFPDGSMAEGELVIARVAEHSRDADGGGRSFVAEVAACCELPQERKEARGVNLFRT